MEQDFNERASPAQLVGRLSLFSRQARIMPRDLDRTFMAFARGFGADPDAMRPLRDLLGELVKTDPDKAFTIAASGLRRAKRDTTQAVTDLLQSTCLDAMLAAAEAKSADCARLGEVFGDLKTILGDAGSFPALKQRVVEAAPRLAGRALPDDPDLYLHLMDDFRDALDRTKLADRARLQSEMARADAAAANLEWVLDNARQKLEGGMLDRLVAFDAGPAP